MSKLNTRIFSIIIGCFAVIAVLLACVSGGAFAAEPDGDYVRIDNVYYLINNTSELVDADLALLEWHSQGNNDKEGDIIVSASFGDEKFERYQDVYAEVYRRLLAAPETTHLKENDRLFKNGYSEDLYIFAVRGRVNYGERMTLGAGKRVLVLAEDETASVRVYYSAKSYNATTSSVPQMELSADASKVPPAIAFQGLNEQQDLPITWSGKPRTDNVFELSAGSIYFNYCAISGFQFRSSSSESAGAANYSFLVLPSGINRKRFVYMSNSSMTELVAREAPGIFCKAYSTSNNYNKESYLYLYNNTFSDCLSTGTNTSAYGGAVIRSYAADQCHLRVKDCTFENNRSTTVGDASGGGAIYWKSVPGDAILNNCTFRGNSSQTVGGAIYNTGTMQIVGCTFEDNYAKNGGGAIAVEPPYTTSVYSSLKGIKMSGSLELDAATILQNNITDGNGGAIYFNAYASQIGSQYNSDGELQSGRFDINEYEMRLDINGAQLLSNKAKGNGGAIAMWLNYEDREYTSGITIDNNSVIRGNIAGYIDENGNGTGIGDGGAIWMSSAENCDCKAELNDGVIMKSGTLSENEAQNGGGIYIETGKPTMSMDFIMAGGTAENNEARVSGGAAYVAGGNFNLNGSDVLIRANTALNGGAVYVDGGNAFILGGAISQNTATQNGGGIAVNNGNYAMVGGNLDNNTATNGKGGGIFVAADGANVNVGIYSGSVSSNKSGDNGGALAVVGEQSGSENINVQIGVDLNHNFDEFGNTHCDHDHVNMVDSEVSACPSVSGNYSAKEGGAIYVTGNNERTALNIFCLVEDADNLNKVSGEGSLSNFMKMEGGKVTITTSKEKVEDLQDSSHGNTRIQSTIYVTGGIMEIWGEMTNPSITDVIIVDITKEGDDFKDYRQNDSEKKYYKLRYYENFKEPGTGVITGQYKQYEIEYGEVVTINASMYNHPGYTIKGWNTKNGWPDENGVIQLDDFPQKDKSWQSLGWYEIQESYTFDENPIGDLVIYAIWEANGYTVVYDPNVPSGESYSGTMQNDEFFYSGLPVTLSKNQYKRPGYDFVGWNFEKEPADSSTNFGDGASVSDLTDEKGVVVTLYAQWKECKHEFETHTYTYKVISNSVQNQTLRRECSCGAYYEDARITAEDTVYNKTVHPAKATYSSAWKPSIVYTALDGDALSNGLPYHAGRYKASITALDKAGNEFVASVEYVIEKAEQTAPPKPKFETDMGKNADGSVLSIYPVDESSLVGTDPYYLSEREYRIVYYENGTEKSTGWTKGGASLIDELFATQFILNKALTNYYVQARYGECDDYKASPESVADSVYFFDGDVEFVVNCGEGVLYNLITADGSDVTVNGIQISIATKDGYFFPIMYHAKIETKAENDAQASISPDGTFANVYSIFNIPKKSKITLTLPDARKQLSILSNITENQVFGKVTTDSATISRDSAYTVYFNVDNYSVNEYKGLALSFSSSLPIGTTIIMQDRKGEVIDYYYYRVNTSGTKNISLSSFIRMGTSNQQFELRDGDLDLQFIVDFSKASSKIEATTLTTTLVSEKKTDSRANLAQSDKKTTMKSEDIFSLEATDMSGVLKFNRVHSSGIASIWDGRDGAIVFTTTQSLPADVYLFIACGDVNAQVYANSEGEFIYSLPNVNTGTLEVSLVSNLLPDGVSTFVFHVRWLVAASTVEKSPMNGEEVDKTNIQVSSEPFVPVSLKLEIDGNKKLFALGDMLNVVVHWKDIPPENHNLEIVLMRKSESGEYVNTGVAKDIYFNQAEGNQSVQFQLSGITSGSYRLLVRAETGLVTVAEAEYYFIIE